MSEENQILEENDRVGVGVRELEYLGEELRAKYRSDRMKKGGSEKEVVSLAMKLKLRDDQRHLHELQKERNKRREELRLALDGEKRFSRVMSKINTEIKKVRQKERIKFERKVSHLKDIKIKEEIKKLEECPEEIIKYKDVKIFSKTEMDKLSKEKVEITRIGEIELDENETALLSLPPKFAVRRRLCSISMQTDVEMGMSKVRYQIQKEDSVREIGENDELEGHEKKNKKRKLLSAEEIDELEEIERIEAEGRRVYDPECKVFDHGNKRATDLVENKKVTLPRPSDNFTESSIEMLRQKIMKTFRKYREKNCTEKGEQESNLTSAELKGLRKLKKRIRNREIVILKTDKSGKLAPMSREKYEKMGKEKVKNDEKIDRTEVRRIERRMNEQVVMWSKILNSGENHEHLDRIISSKQSNSENLAPMYFMFKDHKKEGGYRPVVGGCNSDSLGLSNTLSELVESVCMAVDQPYEVISSEDLLSRISECNEKLKMMRKQKIEKIEKICSHRVIR